MALNGKQRRQLRALGHHRKVVVQVGQHGVTDGVVAAVAQALLDHELVKVQLDGERDIRAVMATQLAEQTQSEIAQSLGKTVLLFKKRKEKSKIELE